MNRHVDSQDSGVWLRKERKQSHRSSSSAGSAYICIYRSKPPDSPTYPTHSHSILEIPLLLSTLGR